MSMTKGTPASSQIIWLEQEVERLSKDRNEVIEEIAAYLDSIHHTSTADLVRKEFLK